MGRVDELGDLLLLAERGEEDAMAGVPDPVVDGPGHRQHLRADLLDADEVLDVRRDVLRRVERHPVERRRHEGRERGERDELLARHLARAVHEPVEELARLLVALLLAAEHVRAAAVVVVLAHQLVDPLARDDVEPARRHPLAEARDEVPVLREDDVRPLVELAERERYPLVPFAEREMIEDELDRFVVSIELERELHVGPLHSVEA